MGALNEVADALKHNSTLKELVVSPDDIEIQHIVNGVQSNTSLRALDYYGHDWPVNEKDNDNAVASLAEMLTVNTTLEKLCFTGDEHQMQFISFQIPNMRGHKEISFHFGGCVRSSQETEACFLRALERNTTLLVVIYEEEHTYASFLMHQRQR